MNSEVIDELTESLRHKPQGEMDVAVSVAIVDESSKRLFLQRRSGTTTYPWHFCTPGGKANEGETLWGALARELYEEHGVGFRREFVELECSPVYVHDVVSIWSGRMTRVTCLYVPATAIVGSYRAHCDAVAGFDWVSADELETRMLTPADNANLDKLIALLR